MNVAEAIRMKRAVREFLDDPLPEEALSTILQAGRRAQSSKNGQTWRFIAMQERDVLKALSVCGPWAGHLAGAALGVAILTPEPTGLFQTMFDAGQAAAYMQLAAWDLGIGSCLASIYEPEQARQILGFPAEWHLRIAISFGYPRDPQAMERSPKKGGREDFAELVHLEHW